MNTRQLQYILTLAEEKNFSEAANKLFISQPSLSQYIKKLEEEIGAELFERTTPLKLTFAGEVYINMAKSVLSIEENTIEKIQDISEGNRGKIKIGSGYVNSVLILPEVMKRFGEKYENVEIELKEDIEPKLMDKLDAGEIDLLIATANLAREDYEKIKLIDEEFLLAVPKRYSIEGDQLKDDDEFDSVRFDVLVDVPFIVMEKSTVMRRLFEKLRKEANLPEDIVKYSCTTNMAAYAMVKLGLGATIIPYSMYVVDKNNTVNYFKLVSKDHKRELFIYFKKYKYMTRVMSLFIDEIKWYFREIY